MPDSNPDITYAAQPNANIEAQARPTRAGYIEWAGLAILALPTALLGLDVTLLYLVMPTLAIELRPSSTQALWIMDAYGFMIAGFLISMGTLGDRIGRRRLLMAGAAAFGVASVLAAFSTSANMLIAARAVLGVAGATLMPSTLALIRNLFVNAQERALAIGIWATMFGLGMAAGPLLGGLLLKHFWWGSAFLVACPVVAIVLIAGPRVLPEYRAPAAGSLDLISVALSLLALLPVIYFVKESAKAGISSISGAALLIGSMFAVAFVRRQRQLANPLLDVRLFENGRFTVALSILFLALIGVGGAMLLVTQYLQLVAGLSPTAAGMWMAPPALMMLAAGVGAPLLARRIHPGLVMAGALALSTLGYVLLALLQLERDIALVVSGYALVYLGLGTIAALGTDLVISAAPIDKAGSASALSETAQELGIAVGVAILGSVTTAIYRSEITVSAELPRELSSAVEDSLWAVSALADRAPAHVIEQAQAAFVQGLSVSSLLAAACAAVLALLSALVLGRDTSSGDADRH